jgi:phage shock protein C
MFCTKCGVELHDHDCFCSQCGNRTGVGRAAVAGRTLMLDKRHKKVAGVCAGLARYMDADVTLIRVAVLMIAIVTGIGFIAYLAAWMIMPSDYGDYRAVAVSEPQAG